MMTTIAAGSFAARWPALSSYWPALLGLLVLYIPTYRDVAANIWTDPENAHGPLILAVIVWIVWTVRDQFAAAAIKPQTTLGWAFIAAGLLAYVFGRSQGIVILEVGSQLPVLAGIVLITRGFAALKTLWFAFLLFIFMIPLPEVLINALTSPLKQQVSAIVAALLTGLGYSVGREGVVLVVGQYHLMVADACSGLGSMFSLSALGLIYLYLVGHGSRWRNAILVASILPIAFAANLIRVLALALITLHLGEAAGQGFMHGAAGIVLFVVALLGLICLDVLLGWVLPNARVQKGAA
jgi:exosortase B